jgi:hypothetical protein
MARERGLHLYKREKDEIHPLSRMSPAEPCYFMTTPAPEYESLIGTAQCYLKHDCSPKRIKVRVLLDSGAGITLIDKATAEEIQLRGKEYPFSFLVAGGGKVEKRVQKVTFQLQSLTGQVTEYMTGLVTEGVGAPFAPNRFNPKEHHYLKHLK